MAPAPSSRWVAQPQVAAPVTFPPPMGGMNTSAPISAMAVTDAVYLYNVHPANTGLRVRDGWVEHATDIAETDIRTLIPFGGTLTAGTDPKLFAVTSGGIYNVTASGNSYTKVATFSTTTGRAGFGSFANFQTAAGSFIAYCDEVNGYWLYTAGTNTWAAVAAGAGAGQINGADPTKFVFVMNWKNRLWFVEKDTANAWYLPVGQITGTVASFGFGSKFPHGGELAAMANWTVDGGAGVDDKLVAVSRAGDVALYEGTDPSSASAFGLRGIWNVGAMPAGRRFMADLGGDLLVLSSRGLTSMMKLIGSTQSAAVPDFYASYRISNLFSRAMLEKRTLDGWSLVLHPKWNMIVVTVPKATVGEDPIQYAMYVPTGAWTVYRGIPILCAAVFQGELYFGTQDSLVGIHTEHLDGTTLAGAAGSPVEFGGLTAFSDMGAPGRRKQIGLIKPIYIFDGSRPVIECEARWDFDQDEVASIPAAVDTTESLFDTASWDSAVWGGTASVTGEFKGAQGTGYRAAIAFRGSNTCDTTITAFDVTVQAGGML